MSSLRKIIVALLVPSLLLSAHAPLALSQIRSPVCCPEMLLLHPLGQSNVSGSRLSSLDSRLLLDLDFFKQVLQDVTGIDADALLEGEIPGFEWLKSLSEQNLVSTLIQRLGDFKDEIVKTLTSGLQEQIINVVITAATKKIAAALPTGVGQVLAILDTLKSAADWVGNQNNINQVTTLFSTSAAEVKKIVDAVGVYSQKGIGDF